MYFRDVKQSEYNSDGGPAFPQFDVEAVERDGHGDTVLTGTVHGGLTVRGYYAGQALPGLIARLNLNSDLPSEDAVARLARRYADALIAELGDTAGVK